MLLSAPHHCRLGDAPSGVIFNKAPFLERSLDSDHDMPPQARCGSNLFCILTLQCNPHIFGQFVFPGNNFKALNLIKVGSALTPFIHVV